MSTPAERTSRKTVLVHLRRDKSAAALPLRDALIAILGALPSGMCRTLTWDQGKEMSAHLAEISVFFREKSCP